MPSAQITVNFRRPFAFPLARSNQATEASARWLTRFLQAVDDGHVEADFLQLSSNEDVAVGSNAYSGPGSAVLVLAAGAGAVGATIAGTLVTVTWATSDTNTMTLLDAAIKANTSVNRIVTSSQREMRLTLASVAAGTTVRICGIVFTAVATAANIVAFGDYNIDGADAADATALALAINRHPALAGRVVATAVSNSVSIFMVDGFFSPFNRITNPSAATITVNVNEPTLGTRLAIIANTPGPIGNEVRATASGTGMTINTAGTAGLLGGGTGGALPTLTFRGQP